MLSIDHTYQVIYSELAQRSLDASFTSEFSIDGRFVRQESRGRTYWYFDRDRPDGKKQRTYVGPVDDPAITSRVENFKDIKADYRARAKLVSTLVREAHLPRPDTVAGPVIEALANAGFFRLRGVLVGTMAFQCYSALLGVRMTNATMQTGDVDFAQFHSISNAIDDAMTPIPELLRQVDPTFREIPHQLDGRYTTKYVTRSGYQVEFLTPNTGSDDYSGGPAQMPTLSGTAAQPLRFLDYLIHQPVRAVVLYGPGIPVLVPAPERFAVHKLIVAARRRIDDDGLAKSRKDLAQAHKLIHVLHAQRSHPQLAEAYMEAWDRGPHWRQALRESVDRLEAVDTVRMVLALGIEKLGADPATYELPPKPAA